VQSNLKSHGVNVTRDSVSQDTTDFSSLIAKIPGNTKVIYIPWQLSPRAQAFGQQLRGAGKNITLFGSDGLFDPSTWKITGSYDSFFPVDTNTGTVKAYAAAHGGDSETFGAPTYAATQVVVGAITRACKDGKATRAEVRQQIARTNIPAAQSILGFRIVYQKNGELRFGGFGIFQIQPDGSYKRVG